MSRLAERDTVQRIGAAARGSARTTVSDSPGPQVERVRPFETFGEGGRPGGQRGLTGFCVPAGQWRRRDCRTIFAYPPSRASCPAGEPSP